MRQIRVRFLADLNPVTPQFDACPDDAEICFMPLETVWADGRLNTSRRRSKREVASGYVRFRSGDILCPKVTPTFQAGRSAIMPPLPHGIGAATTEVHVLRALPERADPRFVRYALLTKRFLEEGVSRFQGVAGLQRVPEDFVADFQVADVPLDVQRQIADFLDDQVTRIDQAIGLRERQIELAATRAKTEVDDLVLGHDSATRTDSIWPPFGLVPHSWLQTRLRSIRTDVRTGPFGTQLHADEYVDEGYPIVNPANLVDSGIRALPGMCVDEATRTRLARHVLQQGDVVFARRGELGRSALVTEKQAGWFCGTGSLVVRLHGDQLLPQYLARLLRTRALRWYFETQSVGSTMANLNTSILMAMPLLVPSLDEQVAIDTEAKGLEATGQAIRETLTRALRLLEERKRSLITAAVTGEFDVTTSSSRASHVVMDGVGG